MNEFDEQTDFSFLGISVEDTDITPTKSKQPNGTGITTVGNDVVKITLLRNYKPTADTRAKISANHRGGPKLGHVVSVETREKQRQKALQRAPRSKESRETQAQKQWKPVMTYYGAYPSLKAVAEAASVSGTTVRKWMKKYPQHYYYIETAK